MNTNHTNLSPKLRGEEAEGEGKREGRGEEGGGGGGIGTSISLVHFQSQCYLIAIQLKRNSGSIR